MWMPARENTMYENNCKKPNLIEQLEHALTWKLTWNNIKSYPKEE